MHEMYKEFRDTNDNFPFDEIFNVDILSGEDENSGMSSGVVAAISYNGIDLISKISSPGFELRQVGSIGEVIYEPWNPYILKNEFSTLTILSDIEENSRSMYPQPVYYQRNNDEKELSIQSRMRGQRLDQCDLSLQFSSEIGFLTGAAIGELQSIKLDDSVEFGSVGEGIKFGSWSDFYLHMVKAGLQFSVSEAIYSKMKRLEGFSSLVRSYEEWEVFCRRLGSFYSSPIVNELLNTDNEKTLLHGDLWQGNMFYDSSSNRVNLFDFDRAMVGGKSYDLAIYLASGNDDHDPIGYNLQYFEAVRAGFESTGTISSNFSMLQAVYGMWWRFDTLSFDAQKGYDRSIKAVEEIYQYIDVLQL